MTERHTSSHHDDVVARARKTFIAPDKKSRGLSHSSLPPHSGVGVAHMAPSASGEMYVFRVVSVSQVSGQHVRWRALLHALRHRHGCTERRAATRHAETARGRAVGRGVARRNCAVRTGSLGGGGARCRIRGPRAIAERGGRSAAPPQQRGSRASSGSARSASRSTRSRGAPIAPSHTGGEQAAARPSS